MNTSQLLNEILHCSEVELNAIRQALVPASKSRALFDYVAHCAAHFEVCTNEGAIRRVYGLNRGEVGYRKAYLSLMRLIEQVAKRCRSLRDITDESSNETLKLSKVERTFVLARSLAQKAKWAEALQELRKLDTEQREDSSADEFVHAQHRWLMFVASVITDATAYSHNLDLQNRVRDTSARAVLHACFMDLVAVELQEIQRTDSLDFLRSRCERVRALKQLPMLARYHEIIEYFAAVLVSGFYTIHRPSEAAPHQQQMLNLNEKMFEYGFSFLATSVGATEQNGEDTDSLYTSALEYLSARDFVNAAHALESFIQHIEGQPDMYARFVNVLLECYLSIGEVSKAADLTRRFGEAMDIYGNSRNQAYATVLRVRVDLYATTSPSSNLFKRVIAAEASLGESNEMRELVLRLKAKYFFLTHELDGLELVFKEVKRLYRRGAISTLSCQFVKHLCAIARSESRNETHVTLKNKTSKAIASIQEIPSASPDYLQYWLESRARLR